MRPTWHSIGPIRTAAGALIVLVVASCAHVPKSAPGDELGSAIQRDGVLPDGAVWRSSMMSRAVCIFGVTDLAAQDHLVDGAQEALRRIGGTRGFESLAIQFWSGEPPPRGVSIRNKPVWRRPGEPPQDSSELNAPYAIRLVRTVEIR